MIILIAVRPFPFDAIFLSAEEGLTFPFAFEVNPSAEEGLTLPLAFDVNPSAEEGLTFPLALDELLSGFARREFSGICRVPHTGQNLEFGGISFHALHLIKFLSFHHFFEDRCR